MKKILLSALMTTSLFATTYTLNPGWNLLGTISEIPVSKILANPEVRNVVIYRNGGYESSASNDFTIIPEKNGFFVYTDSSTTVEIVDGTPPSSVLQHLDGDLNPTEEATWAILKVVDADLLIEMKTSTYNAGLTYTYSGALDYCQNLTVGSVTGWRVPLYGELRSLSDIYLQGNENDFIIRDGSSPYWVDVGSTSTTMAGFMSFDGSIDSNGGVNSTPRYTICVKDL